MERLKGMERAHMLMQSGSRQALQRLLKQLLVSLREQPLSAKVRWSVDVNPLEF
jgi:primosomal protein N' (replication factor Y)